MTKAGYPLIVRWDGVSWHRARAAGPRGSLSGVSAVSPGVAWAVGSSGTGASGSRPLALRWNGNSWTRVPSARPNGALGGVSAVSATDAWAVGAIDAAAGPEGVIEHWDGIRWRTTLIDSTAGSFLTAVTVRGRRLAWAVGFSAVGVLTLAWHGSAWRRVPARCASKGCSLFSVAVVSRHLAWAVGTRLDLYNLSLLPVTMRWNGSAWKAVPSPRAAGVLDGVVALSASSAFAVGAANYDLTSIKKSRPTIEHWNGTTWRLDRQAG